MTGHARDARGWLPAGTGLLSGMFLATHVLWPLELWLAARSTRRAHSTLDDLRRDMEAAR